MVCDSVCVSVHLKLPLQLQSLNLSTYDFWYGDITYNLVSIPTPWPAPYGQLASIS